MGLIQRGSKKVLVVDGCRVVVPQGARKKVLEVVHKAHLGQERTYYCARERFYWPSLREEVFKLVERCPACSEFAGPRKPEKEMVEKPPKGPM